MICKSLLIHSINTVDSRQNGQKNTNFQISSDSQPSEWLFKVTPKCSKLPQSTNLFLSSLRFWMGKTISGSFTILKMLIYHIRDILTKSLKYYIFSFLSKVSTLNWPFKVTPNCSKLPQQCSKCDTYWSAEWSKINL